MGVKHLWKIIERHGKEENPQNLRLAIDTSIWLHYYKNVPTDVFIYHTLKRILKLLYNKNKPIFVFDSSFPIQKKKTIIERQRLKIEELAKKYLKNIECKICKVSYRRCEHANVEHKEVIERKERVILEKIQTSAPQQWGHYYDEEMRILESDKFMSLSKTQKLNILIDLRDKRKLPIKYTEKNGIDFSIDQINNVKKRNRVTEWINKLESQQDKRIMSDCKNIYTFNEDYNVKREKIEVISGIDDIFSDSEEKINDRHIEAVGEENTTLGGEFENAEDNLCWDDDFETSSNESSIIEHENCSSTYVQNKNEEHLNIPYLKESKIQVDLPYAVQGINNEEVIQANKICVHVEELTTIVNDFEHVTLQPVKEELKDVITLESQDGTEIDTRKPTETSDYKINTNLILDDLVKMKIAIKEIIKLFKLPFIDAPVEADSQCAYLTESDLVDGIISEDNDIFLFGGKCLFRNYFKKNKRIMRFNLVDLEETITRKNMVTFSYYTGSDYTVGINGIGPKKALELLSNGDIENDEIKNLLNLYLNPQVKKMSQIEWQKINYNEIKDYISGINISVSCREELSFYLDKINNMQSKTKL